MLPTTSIPFTLNELISLICFCSSSVASRTCGRFNDDTFVETSSLNSARSSSSVLALRISSFSSSVMPSGNFFAASWIRSLSNCLSSARSKMSGVNVSVTACGFVMRAGSTYKSSSVVFVASRNSSSEW